jgi:hypothetical protein
MLTTQFRLWALIVIYAFVTKSTVIAQNQTNNFGQEFRFAFLENYTNFEKVSFVVSSEQKNYTLNISCGIYSASFSIFGKDTTLNYAKLGTPSSAIFDPKANRSILITSSAPITVYAMNNSLNSSDITNIIPTEKIAGNPVYYINTYRGDESLSIKNNSLFTIVALDDSCFINILPTCDSKINLNKDVVFKFMLRKGQVYREEALDSQSFAGTKIWNSKGCKRFSVYEGAKCSFVEYNNSTCKGCDHLYNQSRPIQNLGTKFTTIPYVGNSGGYLYQIVATENNTSISIDNVPTAVLNEREVFTVNQKVNKTICIQSDKNISVVELMKSGDCNGQSSLLGNPSLMTVLPDNQMSTIANFSFPFTKNISQSPSFPAEFYVAIVANSGELGGLLLNGVGLDTNKFTTQCDKKVGTFSLDPSKSYSLYSKFGFNAYMYAFGLDESYATSIGGAFESNKANFDILSQNTSVCDSNFLFQFKAKTDSAATFNWKFGDGTTDMGDSVTKVYGKRGNFLMKLYINYTNSSGCLLDSVEKLITVNTRPTFTFGPDTNLCRGNYFELSPLTPPNVKYLWSNGSTGSLIIVNQNGPIWLELIDSNSCNYRDSININFINCDTSNILIPNVFTPSTLGSQVGDEYNDLFETKFSGFDVLEGHIYNRWGVEVYSFNYPTDSYWNGGLNNELSTPCTAGTYFYIYKFKNNRTGLEKEVNGVVYLIR